MTPALLHTASSLAGWLEDLAPALANHLWQSTAFACAAGLLSLALHRNNARVRFGMWLAASLKFFVPFALLAAIGSHIARPRMVSAPAPALVYTVQDFTAPFDLPMPIPPAVQQAPTLPTRDVVALAAALVWLAGFVTVIAIWIARWIRIARMLQGAPHLTEMWGNEPQTPGTPFMARSDMGGDEQTGPHPCPADTNGAPERLLPILRHLEATAGLRPMQVRLTTSTLEPGVFGIFRPTLAWPAGLSERLTDSQMEAILAHEIAHVGRRDNLFAVLHMLVEAAFWFHPLVWFIGARMLAERERACDEAVTQLCPRSDAYAEGILKVCEFCIESPLACVSGITGADLKRRIRQIMTGRALLELSRPKKAMLVCAAVLALAVPITFGLNNPSHIFGAADILGWEKSAGGHQEFEVASVREDKSGGPGYSNFSLDSGNTYFVPGASNKFSPAGGFFSAKNLPLIRYIVFAYKLSGTQELALRFHFFRDLDTHTPDWVMHEPFDIEARAADHPTKDQMRLMMQSLLAERFKLAVHTETRQAPVFALVLAKPGVLGPHLHPHPAGDSCDGPPPPLSAKNLSELPCGVIAHLPASQPGAHRFGGRAVPLDLLATALPTQTGMASISRPVIDRTGLPGTYDVDLEWTPEDTRDSADNSETGGTFRDALRSQLGLKLESQTGPVELLVIDHVEHPTPQDESAPAASAAPMRVEQVEQPATSAATRERLRYDVVSIRPADPNLPQGTSLRFTDDGFQARGVPFEVLVRVAYHLGFVEGAVEGVPDWAHKDSFDIEARISDSDLAEYTRIVHDFTTAGEARRDAILRNLVAEQFQFRAHLATKEGTIYALVVAKSGAKLQPGSDTEQPSMFLRPRGHMEVKNATVAAVAPAFAQELGRPVVDKTGLAGKYSFTLTWTPDRGASTSPEQPAAPDAPPSLFTALQEQLGLKLVPAKGDIETLVIDHIERPAPQDEEGLPPPAAATVPPALTTLTRVAQASEPSKPLAFEVVSIRENKSAKSQGDTAPTGDGWRMINLPFEALLQLAFVPAPGGPAFFPRGYIVGMPDWGSDRYDVVAKVPQSALADWQKPSQQPAMLHAMLQHLLEERCALKVHRETKTINVLALEVGKSSPKLKPADPNAPPPPPGRSFPGLGYMIPEDGGKSLHFYGANMALLTSVLDKGGTLNVKDRTGLTGKYDFVVHPPEPPARAPGEPDAPQDQTYFAEGIAEQLGLKLVPAKGQVETLVIDHIDRPTEN